MTSHPPGYAEAAADVAGPARPLVVRVEFWSHGEVIPNTTGVYLANEADLAAFVRAVCKESLQSAAPARQDAQDTTAAALGDMVLVPRQPTRAMLDARQRVHGFEPVTDEAWKRIQQNGAACEEEWHAMLAACAPPASPAAPAPRGVAGDVEVSLLRQIEEAEKHPGKMLVAASAQLRALLTALTEARAEVARLREALVQVKHGAEYVDELGDIINAALAATPPAPAAAREADLLLKVLTGIMGWLDDTNPAYIVTARLSDERPVPAWIFDEKRYSEVCNTTDDAREALARLSRAEGQS